jgi:hypothetical protein
MNPKINIITPPDKIFSDCLNILLIHPSAEIQEELQKSYLTITEKDINLYQFEKNVYSPEDIDWLLSIFNFCDICIFNLDTSSPSVRQLAGYFISKPKTYWLTNGDASVYNHISNNRVYNLDFLNGGYFVKT